MMKRLVCTALVFGAVSQAPPAAAMPFCGFREQLVQLLETQHGEVLTARGLHANEQLIEVFASREEGNWTVLMTNASGVSCIMAKGSHWIDRLDSEPPGTQS